MDIEIDEPYVLNTGEPIHFDYCKKYTKFRIDRTYQSIDAYRNSLFQMHGWFVVRFTEEQVFNHSEACCKFLSQIIFLITEDFNFFKQVEDDLPPLLCLGILNNALSTKKGVIEKNISGSQRE